MKGFDFDGELVLPPRLRERLGKVYGRVIQAGDLRRNIGDGTDVYAVGDIVVGEMLQLGIVPKVAIFDYRSRRERFVISDIKKRYTSPLVARSKAGVISKGLWNAVDRASAMNGKVGIMVYGEEDLASLACIYFARNGSLVLYGLRGRGIDIVKVSPNSKRFVLRVLTDMKNKAK